MIEHDPRVALRCYKCKEWKMPDLFSVDKQKKSGRKSSCKACDILAKHAWYHGGGKDRVNRKHQLDLHRTRNYGVDQDAYEIIKSAQGSRCRLCGIHSSEASKQLAVDHDHDCCSGGRSCGQCIRGLLCGPCNLALGHYQSLVAKAGRDRIESYLNAPRIPISDARDTTGQLSLFTTIGRSA